MSAPLLAMSSPAAIRLQATLRNDVAVLVPELESRLNRFREPQVVVTEADGMLCFRSDTWQPILRARVEDALDELLGSAWSCGFIWT